MFRMIHIAAGLIAMALSPSLVVAQDATAARPDMQRTASSGSRFLNPPGLTTPSGYSHAIVAPAGRTIHVSGQLPLDKNGKLVGAGDFAAQAEQVFANLKTALTAAGASFDDVVKLNMYVTDMKQLKALRVARDRYINLQQPPTSTLVEVNRFVMDGAMVEIDATAVPGDSTRK